MRVLRPLTLRARTTALAVVLVALVLGAGSVALVGLLEAQLVAASDEASRDRATDLLARAAEDRLSPLLTGVPDDGVAQAFDERGTVVAASANITGRAPITEAGDSARPTLRVFTGPDDEETETYRAWTASGPTALGEVTVVVGTSLESVQETTARLRALLLIGVPLAVLVLGVVVWLLVGRALGRLDRIRAEVDAHGPTELDRRIDEGGPEDEVGRLAATMNRMLARVDGAVDRQRRLVADVSHDLQTPLARQRLSLEVALRGTGPLDREQLRADLLTPVQEMEALVADLLVLAGADEGATVEARAVDLDQLVQEEAVRAREHAEVTIVTEQVSAGPVRANPGDLRRAVRNLVDNAVAYARTTVELRVTATDSAVVLDVLDDGPGVPTAERDVIFERFHRGDRSRSDAVPGSGLGLAIARTLTERSGGTLDLVESDHGALFRMVLPPLAVPTS